MIIDDIKKFIFIHTPKTGGTSITEFFSGVGRKDPLPLEHHITYEQCLKEKPEIKDYFSFAFVRNPWNRVVSSYHDTTILERTTEKTLSFKEFVKQTLPHHLSKKPEHNTIHYFPCYYFLGDDINFIGRTETIIEDFTKIQKILSLEGNLPHARNSSRKEKEYRNFYDVETKQIVEELYIKDIEEFGYEF